MNYLEKGKKFTAQEARDYQAKELLVRTLHDAELENVFEGIRSECIIGNASYIHYLHYSENLCERMDLLDSVKNELKNYGFELLPLDTSNLGVGAYKISW